MGILRVERRIEVDDMRSGIAGMAAAFRLCLLLPDIVKRCFEISYMLCTLAIGCGYRIETLFFIFNFAKNAEF